MVLGICTNMNARSTTDLGLDQVPYCRQIGLEYVEFSVDRIMAYSDARFEALRKALSESPLPCLACNNFIDPGVRLVGNEYDQARSEVYIVRALERISSLGARKVVFGSAKARSIPSYISAEEGRKQILDRLRFIAGAAEKFRIEVEIEHLNRTECNVINTFEESVAIAKQLNFPNVKSIFDSYHFEVSGERKELIRQNEAWIGHMHFACTMGRHMPDLEDAKSMTPLLSILRDCAYDGTFSIEAYFPNHEMDDLSFQAPIAYMRDILNGKKE
jgi:sugar phosphate isomerase/epimerase